MITDKHLNRFEKRLENLPVSVYSVLNEIQEIKGRWIAGVRLHPQTLKKLKESVLVTSTGASTRIEGSKLSDEDIEKMLRGLPMQKFADRDKQEVKGYLELLSNIFHSWNDISFNEGSIKHLHKELLKYVDKDKLHRGEYKTTENRVQMIDNAGNSIGILFNTTPAYLTPSEMKDLIEWTKTALKEKKYHPLLVIGNFIVQFLQIHPFNDGNGRLSRILTNLLLLKSEYAYIPYISHEKIIEDNKPDYYFALRASQKTFGSKQENITEWVVFFLKIILKQAEEAISLLSNEHIEKTLSEKQLQVWNLLHEKQELTRMDIYMYTGIRPNTINQILNKFIQLKKIERLGMGRGTKYRLLKS